MSNSAQPNASKAGFVRQQLFVDPQVQGVLVRRAALYSTACTIYFVVIAVFATCMSDPDRSISDSLTLCLDEAIYWAPGLILLAPLVIYDMLKVTNRFAGPVFSLRREMQRLIDNKSERPLKFREGDTWTDLASRFNLIREEVLELRKANRELKHELNKGTTAGRLFDDSSSSDGDEDEMSAANLVESILVDL
ncbi:hypothetical protein N9N28_06040 [Rubripirellula amarantea]|uniref:HAMP domain-containing protein n=1 Tax=Rubripirellula amarantea TaxID=2527999 RepID=A0A5C5WRP5_9BACT|nr:hypothetical protein [Rubripirellula amarantea]MDA8744176.1 hypothetical protein [Rubripirellula amarantea]TWT53248.1 hypothetical protein Pla22_08760 [Rubripirellula amarantea]